MAVKANQPDEAVMHEMVLATRLESLLLDHRSGSRPGLSADWLVGAHDDGIGGNRSRPGSSAAISLA